MFIMLLSEPHSTDPSYKAIKVNVMESCVAKSLSLICLWTPIEMKHLKTKVFLSSIKDDTENVFIRRL